MIVIEGDNPDAQKWGKRVQLLIANEQIKLQLL